MQMSNARFLSDKSQKTLGKYDGKVFTVITQQSLRVKINFAELQLSKCQVKTSFAELFCSQWKRWAPLEGNSCILKNLQAQTKSKTLCTISSLFWFMDCCCEGFVPPVEQTGWPLFLPVCIYRIVSWDNLQTALVGSWWPGTLTQQRFWSCIENTSLNSNKSKPYCEKNKYLAPLDSEGIPVRNSIFRAGRKQLRWTSLKSTGCLDFSEENLPELSLCSVAQTTLDLVKFYQIQTLFGSSEMLTAQPLGNQLYATVTPSSSPSGPFLQSSVNLGISELQKKHFHFSVIISLHKEKLGIIWKERRMLRNSPR